MDLVRHIAGLRYARFRPPYSLDRFTDFFEHAGVRGQPIRLQLLNHIREHEVKFDVSTPSKKPVEILEPAVAVEDR